MFSFKYNFTNKNKRYAESYNALLSENLSLKDEIKDLKQNLNINKEVINSFFKEIKENKKNAYGILLQKLSEENVSIYKQIEKISNERNKLRSELIQIKDEKVSGQDQLSQENNQLKTKIFLLEQDIVKKNNIILLTRQ